jgi:ABC-type uncharacterized transport system permease subunit
VAEIRATFQAESLKSVPLTVIRLETASFGIHFTLKLSVSLFHAYQIMLIIIIIIIIIITTESHWFSAETREELGSNVIKFVLVFLSPSRQIPR